MESNETVMFEVGNNREAEVKDIILRVCKSLREKGYNPISQIAGYILSGDPTYITSYENSRSLVRKVERDELIEEFLKAYLEKIEK